MGEHVEFPSGGGPSRGYLATPDHGSAGPALIVLGPLLGLEANITTVCDRFAAEGFTALAPEVFGGAAAGEGEPGEGVADEGGRVLGVNLPVTLEHLRGAIAFLEDHPDVHGQGVGVAGFEWGALVGLAIAAEATKGVKAVVLFDGPILDEVAAGQWAGLEAPAECHLGAAGSDHLRDEVDALLAAAKELKLSVDAFTYASAAPGFFDETRPEVYDADAAHDAWIRTLSFLRAHLG